MKSRVRFEVFGRVAVDQGCDYSGSAVIAEVANGELIALSVEVEHADDWALYDIVEAARAALRPLCALIGIGRGIEPVLGGALVSPMTVRGPSIELGFADAQGRVVIVRQLKTLPPESLLTRLRSDLRLARQVDYLNSAEAATDIVSRIRYAYLVLEQEQEKGKNYVPLEDYTHIRDALSHPEVGFPKVKKFLRKKIGSAQLDYNNPDHKQFLQRKCVLLTKEARRIVEECVASFGFQYWC